MQRASPVAHQRLVGHADAMIIKDKNGKLHKAKKIVNGTDIITRCGARLKDWWNDSTGRNKCKRCMANDKIQP